MRRRSGRGAHANGLVDGARERDPGGPRWGPRAASATSRIGGVLVTLLVAAAITSGVAAARELVPMEPVSRWWATGPVSDVFEIGDLVGIANGTRLVLARVDASGRVGVVSWVPVPGGVADADRIGDSLLVAGGRDAGDMYRYDLSDPGRPRPTGYVATPEDWITGAVIEIVSPWRAYLGAGDAGILIVDLSDPETLDVVDTIPPPDDLHRGVRALAQAPGFLYAFGIDGMLVLDVADTDRPVLHRMLDFGWHLRTPVVVLDTVMYVGRGRPVDVYDITDPGSPVLLGPVFAEDEDASALAVDGNRLLLGAFGTVHRPGTLEVYDIGSNPLAPAFLGSLELPEYSGPVGALLDGDVAVLARADTGLWIGDVGDPSQIGIRQVPEIDGGAVRLADVVIAADGTAVVADRGGRVRTFEAGVVAAPRQVGQLGGLQYGLNDQQGPWRLALDAGLAAVVSGFDGGIEIFEGATLDLVDVGEPAAPRHHDGLHRPFAGLTSGTGVAIRGGRAWVANGYLGRNLVGVDLEAPDDVGRAVDVRGLYAIDVAASRSALVVATLDDVCVTTVRDIAAPGDFRCLAATDDQGRPRRVAKVDAADHRLYALSNERWNGSDEGWLHVFDWPDHGLLPREVGRLELTLEGGYPWEVDLDAAGDRVILALGAAGLLLVDVSSPTDPAVVGHGKPVEAFSAVAARGRLVVACDEQTGLAVFDIGPGFAPGSDPADRARIPGSID